MFCLVRAKAYSSSNRTRNQDESIIWNRAKQSNPRRGNAQRSTRRQNSTEDKVTNKDGS